MALPFQSSGAHRKTLLPWIALLVVWFVWGSTFLGIRVAVSTIPPLLMAGSRYVVAGTLLGLIIWLASGAKRVRLTRSEAGSILVSAVLLLAIGNGSLSYGEVHVPSGVAALIVASVPIWMFAINAVLEKKLHALALAGFIVGTLGIVALVGIPSTHVRLGDAAVILVGSFSWALGSVIVRRRGAHQLNPLLPALEMLAGGIVMCVAGVVTGETHALHPAQISAISVAGWLWLVVMGAMVAYSAYAYAVRTLPTNVVATYAYVNPIVAVVLGALLLKEPLTLGVLAGGAAIVIAVICIMLGSRAEKPRVVRVAQNAARSEEREPAAAR